MIVFSTFAFLQSTALAGEVRHDSRVNVSAIRRLLIANRISLEEVLAKPISPKEQALAKKKHVQVP
jgi:hypothetical protein